MPKRTHNSTYPEELRFNGTIYAGPTELYRLAKPTPSVSLETFFGRLRKHNKTGELDEVSIKESLYLTVEEYQQKHSIRKTWIDFEGKRIDLYCFYQNEQSRATVSYSAFYQRLKSFRKKETIDTEIMENALTFETSDWISFYGGGRHRKFIYMGELYPAHFGKKFHGISAFLKTIERYLEKGMVWSRIKAGWDIDSALSIPIDFKTERTGLIYKITRVGTGQIYIGLTLSSIDQRWNFHVYNAMKGSQTELAQAIQEDGPDGFIREILEDNIENPEKLKEREIYWVKNLGALGPNGLNIAKPGGIGGAHGVAVEWEGEKFQSITEASYVIGKRENLAPYTVESRLRSGRPLPKRQRKHSKHKDAGSNLFRRWLALKNRYPNNLSLEWRDDFDAFKSDVGQTFHKKLKLMRIDKTKPWGSQNWYWGSATQMIEATHGKSIKVYNVKYPSLKALADAFGIGYSTMKNRIREQGLTPEEAVERPLGKSSFKKAKSKVEIDNKSFRSKRQAILYISKKHGLTEGQAKYRFEKGEFSQK